MTRDQQAGVDEDRLANQQAIMKTRSNLAPSMLLRPRTDSVPASLGETCSGINRGGTKGRVRDCWGNAAGDSQGFRDLEQLQLRLQLADVLQRSFA